jgi:hypothetical protein
MPDWIYSPNSKRNEQQGNKAIVLVNKTIFVTVKVKAKSEIGKFFCFFYQTMVEYSKPVLGSI